MRFSKTTTNVFHQQPANHPYLHRDQFIQWSCGANTLFSAPVRCWKITICDEPAPIGDTTHRSACMYLLALQSAIRYPQCKERYDFRQLRCTLSWHMA